MYRQTERVGETEKDVLIYHKVYNICHILILTHSIHSYEHTDYSFI